MPFSNEQIFFCMDVRVCVAIVEKNCFFKTPILSCNKEPCLPLSLLGQIIFSGLHVNTVDLDYSFPVSIYLVLSLLTNARS